MSPTAAKILPASAASIELEVAINAPQAKVWRALIEQPDAWWISDLRCVSADSTLTLEPRAGGNLVESDGAGASLLWFTVIALEPERSLNLAGAIAPPFGGPAQTFLLIELAEEDGVTTVKLTNSMHGHVDEASLPATEAGWRLLLDNGLKHFVETGARA